MNDLQTHKLKGLSQQAREVLEKLIGRHLGENEEISIWASQSQVAPAGEIRNKAWQQLNSHLDLMATKAQGSSDEFEKIVDEICDEVRHGPK